MQMIRKALAAIEPWYDWGSINTFNLNARSEDEVVEGEVRYFELQWFGIHLAIHFGRTPVAAQPNG